MKIILLVILVLTLVLCFIKLGAICTVVLAFGILIILGIYALLKSSKLSRKKKESYKYYSYYNINPWNYLFSSFFSFLDLYNSICT